MARNTPNEKPEKEHNKKEMIVSKTRDQIQKLTKIITLSDIHYPDNIDLSGVIEMIKDEQPDEIIYIGDVVNATGISKYSGRGFEEGMYDTIAEFEGFMKEVHAPLQKAAPKAKFIITLGNHDGQRIEKAIDAENGVPDRKRLLDFKKLLPGIQCIPYGKLYNKGNLSYTHGMYYNEYCAKKQMIATGRNTIFGHTHTVNEFAKRSMVDDEPMTSKTIGCLTNTDPRYRQGEPNSWINAFHIAYIRKDGRFYEYTIKMLKDGTFLFNNKLYGGKKGK